MANYPWDNYTKTETKSKTNYPWDEAPKEEKKVYSDALEAQRLSAASKLNTRPVQATTTGMPLKAQEYESTTPTVKAPQMSYTDFKKAEYNIPSVSAAKKPAVNERAKGSPAVIGTKKSADNQPSWGKVIGSSLGSGVAQTNVSMFNVPRKIIEGVSIGLDKVLPDFIYNKEMQENDPIKNALDKAVKSNEERAQNFQKDLEGTKGIKGFVAAGLPALPQIAMAAVGGAATQGSAALAKLPEAARQLIPFGTLAAGGYAKEAEDEGATYGQQVAYGLLGGTAEAATEVIPLGRALDLMKKFGAGNIAEKGAKTLIGKYGKTGVQIIENLLLEGAQEGIMSPLGRGAQKLTYKPNMAMTGEGGVIDLKDIKDSAYAGISMAAILGGLGLPSAYASHKLAAEKIENKQPITPDFIQNELMPALQKDTITIENESVQGTKIKQAPSEFNWALNQVIAGKKIPTALEVKYPVLVDFRNNLEAENNKTQSENQSVKLGQAIWKNKDYDVPVEVVGDYGTIEEERYVRIKGSDTGIPLSEIKYDTNIQSEVTPDAPQAPANEESIAQGENNVSNAPKMEVEKPVAEKTINKPQTEDTTPKVEPQIEEPIPQNVPEPQGEPPTEIVTLPTFGQVEVLSDNGSVVKVRNKNGTEIPIGKVAFENMKKQTAAKTQQPEADSVEEATLAMQSKQETPKMAETLKAKLDKLISEKASNAEIKATQDEIDRMNLQSFAKETDQKVSQFYSNSLLNSTFIPDKAKGMMDESDFLYDVQTNEGQLEEAAKDIDFNAEMVESSLRKSEAIRSGVESAKALLLTKIKLEEAANTGDYSETLGWIRTIRPKITSTAQALQATSMWKRFTPENVLMQAEKTVEEFTNPAQEKRINDKGKEIDKKFKETEKDAADVLAKEVEEGAAEGASEVINDAEKEIRQRKAAKKAETDKDKPNVTQKDVDGVDPVELLVKKIEFQLKDPKVPEYDFITDMVNELFKVAKESPLPEKASIKRNPIELLKQAVENREQYKEVWTKAKEKLKEKYSLDNVTLNMLDDYFSKGIKPVFSEKTMDAVLKRYVSGITLQKDKRQIESSKIPKLAEIVKTYYLRGESPAVTLVDNIVKEAGLTGEDAAILAKHIKNRMHKLTKAKKEEILARVFADKTLPKTDRKYDNLSELINMGAFKNDIYTEKAQQKLKNSLNAMIKDAKLNLGDIAKQSYTNNRISRLFIIGHIQNRLNVNPQDAIDIADVIAKTFDELVEEKRDRILNNTLEANKKERKRKAFYDKILELYNLGGFEKSQYRNLIAEKLGIPHLTDANVKEIVDLTQRLSLIPEKGLDNLIERESLEMQILAVVQNLVPASISKKISTVQAIQQLLNAKTFDRNIIGNVLMYKADRAAKYLATAIDYGKSKFTGSDRQITFKTSNNFNIWGNTTQYWKDITKAARAAMEGYSLYGYDPASDSKFLNTPANVFKGKWNPAVYLNKALSISLGAFDYASYMRGVYDKIGELAYLDGINKGLRGEELDKNAQQFIKNIDKEIFEIAKDYGDYVTFKEQDNPIGNAFAGLKDVLNVVGVGRTTGHVKSASVKEFGLGDILIKYARTPGVLLSRGFEFSPAGILKAFYHIGQAQAAHKRGETFDSKIITETLSRALFGTMGFTGLGFALASLGVITSSPEDNDKANDLAQAMGLGNYKLNVSALFRWFGSGFDKEQTKAHQGDKIMSYDWLQPISMPVSLGANFQKNRLDAKSTAETVKSSLEGMFDTITDTTLLQNVSRMASGYSNMQTFETAAQNAITGFTGTLTNQVRQFTDNKMRNAYEGDFLEKTGNMVKNRIPGLSKTLPERVNILGQTMTYYPENKNVLAKFFDVFINPAIMTEYKATPGTEMIKSLYDKYGETAQIPNEVPKSLTVDGIKVELTQVERNNLQKNIGKEVLKDLDKKAANKVFTGAKAEQQVKQIESMIAKKRTDEYNAFRNYLRRRNDERLRKTK